MGFVLTVIYIALTFVGPEQVFPVAWATYRPMLWLAILALIASIGSVRPGTAIFRFQQTYGLSLFVIVVVFSQVVQMWLGGALLAFEKFFPSAIVYYLLVLNANALKRVRLVAFTIVVAAIFLLGEAIRAYYTGWGGALFLLKEGIYSGDVLVGNLTRIRALGFLNDPNDFAQYLVVMLPLIWLAWSRRKVFRNLLFVLLPTAYVLYGIYLTHSRGALLGLAVVLLLALQPRLGRFGATIVALGTILAMAALNFAGGREISVSAGVDRLELWSTALQLFKQSPIFGVGYGGFTDYAEQTAHNSFLLCLAELGVVGFTVWLLLIVTTVQDLKGLTQEPGNTAPPEPEDEQTRNPGIRLEKQDRSSNLRAFSPQFSSGTASLMEEAQPNASTTDPIVIARWARAIRLSLFGFLATAWFLSRTYEVTLYLLIGLAVCLTALPSEHPKKKQLPLGRTLPIVAALEVAVVVVVYATLRLAR